MRVLKVLPTDGQLEIRKMVIRAPKDTIIQAVSEFQLNIVQTEIAKNNRQGEVSSEMVPPSDSPVFVPTPTGDK